MNLSRQLPVVMAKVRLDWSKPEHWSDEQKPCRKGDGPTRGRDSQGLPCHQSCAEQELAAERTKTPDGCVVDERHAPEPDATGGAQ